MIERITVRMFSECRWIIFSSINQTLLISSKSICSSNFNSLTLFPSSSESQFGISILEIKRSETVDVKEREDENLRRDCQKRKLSSFMIQLRVSSDLMEILFIIHGILVRFVSISASLSSYQYQLHQECRFILSRSSPCDEDGYTSERPSRKILRVSM